jgi:hypothetical protein
MSATTTTSKGRNKGAKRTMSVLDSPPTSPIKPSASSVHESEHVEKKARVEPHVDQAVAPQLERAAQDTAIGTALARLATPLPVSEYDSMSVAMNQATALPAPISDLLRPLDSRVQRMLDKKLFDWWKNELYFANKKWDHRQVTPKHKAITGGQGWIDITCAPQQPRFRSCPWVDVASFVVTRGAVEEAAQRRIERGEKDDKGNNYFTKTMVMSGQDYISMQEQKYMEYLQNVVVPTAMLLLARSKANFTPKTQLLMRLTTDGRGQHKSLEDVPLNDPELLKIRDEWLAKHTMQCMHQYFGTESGKFVYYTKKVDAWKDGEKIPWGQKVAVKVAVVMPDCTVQSFPVDESSQVALLQNACPFTVEHGLSMRVKEDAKETRFNVNLTFDSVTFYPQQAVYMKMKESNRGQGTNTDATDEEREAMKQVYSLTYSSKPQPLALTHQPDESRNEQFGAYRVEHA